MIPLQTPMINSWYFLSLADTSTGSNKRKFRNVDDATPIFQKDVCHENQRFQIMDSTRFKTHKPLEAVRNTFLFSPLPPIIFSSSRPGREKVFVFLCCAWFFADERSKKETRKNNQKKKKKFRRTVLQLEHIAFINLHRFYYLYQYVHNKTDINNRYWISIDCRKCLYYIYLPKITDKVLLSSFLSYSNMRFLFWTLFSNFLNDCSFQALSTNSLVFCKDLGWAIINDNKCYYK